MKHALRLYVTPGSLHSARAQQNLSALCEEHLPGAFELEVIDVFERPELAEEDNVLAVPTLIRRHPLPARRVVGDLSNAERVLAALDLELEVES